MLELNAVTTPSPSVTVPTMPSDEKSVRYTLTHKDLFAFNFRALVRNRLTQITALLMAAFFVYMGITTPPKPGKEDFPLPVKIAVGLVMGVIIVALVFGVQVLLLTAMIWSKKYKGLLGEHELTLTDAGLFTRSPDGESRRHWTGLFKVVNTGKHLYLYVNETMAQIIPLRYFASPAAAREFERAIRERMKPG